MTRRFDRIDRPRPRGVDFIGVILVTVVVVVLAGPVIVVANLAVQLVK